MGIFGTIFKTVVHVAVLPFSVVKDVVTLGGAIDDSESAVKENIIAIKEDLDELTD